MGDFGGLGDVCRKFTQKTLRSPTPTGVQLMFRNFAFAFLVLAISAQLGCRFCSSPYDYCPPTYTGSGCDNFCGDPCDPNYTAGSRFYGTENVCRSACTGCNSGCGGCSTGESEHYVPSEQPSPRKVERPETPEGQTLRRVPPAPAAPKVAVPQKIKSASNVRPGNSSQITRLENVPVPVPSQSKAQYAEMIHESDFTEDASGAPFSLEELKRLHPDAADVKIIGVVDQQ